MTASPGRTRGASATAVAGVLAFVLMSPWGAAAARGEEDPAARVESAREAYRELMRSPDHSIPGKLLKDCKAIAIFPHVVKGAWVIGARYGKGVICCRDSAGRWSPPAFFTLIGGSIGWQIGAEATDVVLVFMSTRGTKTLLANAFTLGGSLSVAVGPVGRSAEASTDATLTAEIYSYALSKGAYAGLSLEGARIAVDDRSAQTFYGAPARAGAILFEHRVPRRPPEVQRLLGALP